MMWLPLTLLVVGAITPLAAADKVVYTSVPKNLCYGACNDGVGLITFGDANSSLDYYNAHFQSDYWLTSMIVCLDTYCDSEAHIEEGWKEMISQAVKYSETGVDYKPTIEEARAKVNKSDVQTIDVLNPPAPMINNTIIPTQQNYDDGFRTEAVWIQQMIHHHAFGWALYLLLAIMLIVGIGNRMLLLVAARLHRGDPEDMHLAPLRQPSLGTRLNAWYRRHISMPALFGYRHQQPWGWFSVPTRIQAILIFIYVLLNLVWSFTNYETWNTNMYWPGDRTLQWVRYFSDRTGIMSFYNLPLLWVFAGRNDILMWLTGWSYQSLNLFHRWVARVATIQAIAHSAGYTWLEREYLAESFKERYWATGVFATVTMCLLLPFSILPLRQKLYEFFLLVHIALALATLVLLFYHVEVFIDDYDGYLWACVAIWSFDRLLRIVRIVMCSWKTFFSGGRNTVAMLTGGDAGLVRLSIRSSFPATPRPGSYYFLYTPRSFTPWENHPFTLASWDKTAEGTTLHFLMAPQGGATRRLKRRIERAEQQRAANISASGSAETNMRVLLEGPYGSSHPVGSYDHVLLIAGGSGITAILPYVYSLGKKGHGRKSKSKSEQASNQDSNPVTHRVRHITVVWVVKNAEYAADVLRHELAPNNTDHVTLEIYVTREDGDTAQTVVDALARKGADAESAGEGSSVASGTDTSENIASPDKEKAQTALTNDNAPSTRLTSGRPHMCDLVSREIGQLVGAERLAVLACGPSGMMDDLRQSVANSYGSGEGQVAGGALEYFEEAFGW